MNDRPSGTRGKKNDEDDVEGTVIPESEGASDSLLLNITGQRTYPVLSFVEKNYKELKTVNPKLPILIRECSGTEPQMWARYDLGVEKGIRLDSLTEQQISNALEQLAKVGTGA